MVNYTDNYMLFNVFNGYLIVINGAITRLFLEDTLAVKRVIQNLEYFNGRLMGINGAITRLFHEDTLVVKRVIQKLFLD